MPVRVFFSTTVVMSQGPQGRLVAMGDGTYRLEEDTTGTRSLFEYQAAFDTWLETGKDGVLKTYEPVVVHPLVGSKTYQYALVKQVDTFGNEIHYTFHADGRLHTLSYGGNVNGEPAEVVVYAGYKDRRSPTETCYSSTFRPGFALQYKA